MSRFLVLGAGGMLGSHVVRTLATAHVDSEYVIASTQRFSNSVEVFRSLDESLATTVINCIGYTGSDSAEHFRVNGCLPRAIADWCSRNGALCIHISTNAMFPPDETRLWGPDDEPDPGTVYEVAKAFGEDPRAYVIRASFIGASPKGTGLYNRLKSDMPFRERKWNGVTALALAEKISGIAVLHDGACVGRVVHIYSAAIVTISELATLLGSHSVCEGPANDTRLLGHGEELVPIVDQLAAYGEFLRTSRGSL